MTFNAAAHAGTHAIKAVSAALKMASSVEGLTVGVATGVALVGNFGTTSLRKFCTIGNVYHHATVLQRLTKMLPGSKCLVSESAFGELEQAFYFRVLCGVQLPHSKRCSAIANVESAISQPGANEDSEWLYTVNQHEVSNPYAADNAKIMEQILTAKAEAAATDSTPEG